MGFKSPLVSLGVDAWTGKPYDLCSRKSLVSLTAILLLILLMASERLVFKMMVDRMESYRYFLCQLMTFLYIPPLFCIVGYRSTQDDFIEEEVTEFPKIRFFVMGMLDLLQSMLMFLAGGKTPPSLTVLLMQASIPASACFSFLFFRTRYSGIQVIGLSAIACGLVVSLLPSVEDFDGDDWEATESAWNSLFYLLAAVPGALSMLYKEKAIQEQPMDMVYLNAWVSVFQLVGGLVIAPIVFDVKFLHLNQRLSGLECLVNGKSEVETDQCQFGILLLLGYIGCNVAMNFVILFVIRMTSVNVMYRTAMIGTVCAFFLLEAYELDSSFRTFMFSSTFPPPYVTDLLSCVIIFVGTFLFHWDQDPDVEAITASAEDREAASLLNGVDEYGLRYT